MYLPLLAISTSQNHCTICIVTENQEFFCEDILQTQNVKAGDTILPSIVNLAKKARLSSINDIKAIAIDRGPGAFTGLRMGISIAKGLGFGLKIPIFPISSLLATAFSNCNLSKVIAVGLDARLNEAYCAAYQFDWKNTNNPIKLIFDECLIKYSDFENKLSLMQQDHISIGTLDSSVKKALPLAENIAKLALLEIKQNKKPILASDLEPVYVRNNVAKAHSSII